MLTITNAQTKCRRDDMVGAAGLQALEGLQQRVGGERLVQDGAEPAAKGLRLRLRGAREIEAVRSGQDNFHEKNFGLAAMVGQQEARLVGIFSRKHRMTVQGQHPIDKRKYSRVVLDNQ